MCSYLHWLCVYIEQNTDKLLTLERIEVNSDDLKLVDDPAYELLGLLFL